MTVALAASLALFPTNGLDRSLHVAIVVGLLFITFFSETYGWLHAGLVAPGFLAAVAVVAPSTAAFMMVEAIVVHAVTYALGRWLPMRFGAWSSSFGRERFLLYIVVALIVRLFMEGSVVPHLWQITGWAHARELYSIGLVIVPLIANIFWTGGLRYGLPRLVMLSVLTWIVLVVVLLPYTNYSLSRFLVVNESGAVAFLQSPKAYLLLVTGTLLAARNNVLHGWDYNGILVPGLLAVAWYEPLKALSALGESLLVYALARGVAAIPPFGELLVGRSRRMLVVVVLGLAVKIASGFALMRWWPSLLLFDFLGFGYILPSLLAIKYWDLGRIGIVFLPTLQVSLVAFVLGNVVGYGLRLGVGEPQPELPPAAALAEVPDAVFELTGADAAPHQGVTYRWGPYHAAARLMLEAAGELQEGGAVSPGVAAEAASSRLRISRDTEGWWSLAREGHEADADPPAPRLAVRAGAPDGGWLVLVDRPERGSSLITAAGRVARHLDAAALVVLSRHERLRARDVELAREMGSALSTRHVLRVEQHAGSATLYAVGRLPGGIDLEGLGRALRTPVALLWRQDPDGDVHDRAQRLELPQTVADEVAADVLGTAPVERWPESVGGALEARRTELTRLGPDGYEEPTLEQLRLFDAVLVPGLMDDADRGSQGRWPVAVAHRLGYRFARIGERADGQPEAWALAQIGAARRGGATWVVRSAPAGSRLGIQVPAPRWELGTSAVSLDLYDALQARSLLWAGAMPHADPRGRADPTKVSGMRSYYQRIHERWLGQGGLSVSVQGIAEDRTPAGADVVLTVGHELAGQEHEPPWLAPVRQALTPLGMRVRSFDGSRELAPFGGGADPSIRFAETFAPDRHALLWMTATWRRRFAAASRPSRLELPGAMMHADVALAAWALRLASCAPGPADPDCPPALDAARDCPLAEVVGHAELWTAERNPYARARVVAASGACVVEQRTDAVGGRAWLVIARPGEVALVPMHERTAPAMPPSSDPAAVARAVAMGMRTVHVVAP